MNHIPAKKYSNLCYYDFNCYNSSHKFNYQRVRYPKRERETPKEFPSEIPKISTATHSTRIPFGCVVHVTFNPAPQPRIPKDKDDVFNFSRMVPNPKLPPDDKFSVGIIHVTNEALLDILVFAIIKEIEECTRITLFLKQRLFQ